MKTVYEIKLKLSQPTRFAQTIKAISIKTYNNFYTASEKKCIGIINIRVQKSFYYFTLDKSINSKSLLDGSFNVTCKLKILI